MNDAPTPLKSRRRWRWVLIALLLSPLLARATFPLVVVALDPTLPPEGWDQVRLGQSAEEVASHVGQPISIDRRENFTMHLYHAQRPLMRDLKSMGRRWRLYPVESLRENIIAAYFDLDDRLYEVASHRVKLKKEP